MPVGGEQSQVMRHMVKQPDGTFKISEELGVRFVPLTSKEE